jgi:hypothetical protein
MSHVKRTIAFFELLFIFPAALFMTSLFVRNLQPTAYQPARSAQAVVDWFSPSPKIGLGVLLILLPLINLILGATVVVRSWSGDTELRLALWGMLSAVRAHLAVLLILGATVVSAEILAIVGLHVLTD